MKIYIDLLLILNFIIDYLILYSVYKLLRRNIKKDRLILGSFIGSFSSFLIFLNINNLLLILFELIISTLMIIISFKYINLKYTIENIFYFYLTSVSLGGIMYLIINLFPNIHTNFKINFIFLIIFIPLIIYIYINKILNLKNIYSNYYPVYLIIDNKKYKYTGYLDTANTLKDPLTGKLIILLDQRKRLFKIKNYRYIPYSGVEDGILKVIKIDKLIIKNKEYNNILLGLINKINIDGVDIILNRKMG